MKNCQPRSTLKLASHCGFSVNRETFKIRRDLLSVVYYSYSFCLSCIHSLIRSHCVLSVSVLFMENPQDSYQLFKLFLIFFRDGQGYNSVLRNFPGQQWGILIMMGWSKHRYMQFIENLPRH